MAKIMPQRTHSISLFCSTPQLGHVRIGVVVEEESAYQAWLREQQTFAQLSAPGEQGKRADAILGQKAGGVGG